MINFILCVFYRNKKKKLEKKKLGLVQGAWAVKLVQLLQTQVTLTQCPAFGKLHNHILNLKVSDLI